MIKDKNSRLTTQTSILGAFCAAVASSEHLTQGHQVNRDLSGRTATRNSGTSSEAGPGIVMLALEELLLYNLWA